MTSRRAEQVMITGVVQGVGFRPFVYRLATELGLDGIVGNDATQVFVLVAGDGDLLDRFAVRLRCDAPPLARIDAISRTTAADDGHRGFHIVESAGGDGERTLVPPDAATCDDCLREFRDPANRRFRHPFITCTNCGPRFTIIRTLPYDRPATTMAAFEMCPACRAEYDDPADRRHHAQPIACHDCGPRLRLATPTDAVGDDIEPIIAAVDLLTSDGVVAVKGLGGFHLACDATSARGVAALRRRKHRPDKPFAVMVPDLATAQRFADVDADAAGQLTSSARPIVLAPASSNDVVPEVAPGNPLLGLMLPSTPLHHLLFDAGAPPLVMTSANHSGEPLLHRDDDIDRVLALCDAALTHDRPIHVPADDSVVRPVAGHLLPIRRARGYAPLPVPVGGGRRSVLAVGGELKNACCVASPEHAFMSQHLGDMENLATMRAFERSVAQLTACFDVEPDVVAVDAHPGYATAAWARRHHGERVVEVQHHHAHVASVMAEHELDPHTPILGLAFDGTGYGDDGTIWGGEALVASADRSERVAHLVPVPLPGGDAAVRHPSRVALAHLDAAEVDWADDLSPVAALTTTERRLLRRQLERDVACVPTTSMGRLFDAVASLLGLRHVVGYEAQAAIDLEIAAVRATGWVPTYRFGVGRPDGEATDVIDQRPVVVDVVRDLRDGLDVGAIALGFHRAVADAALAVAERIGRARAITTVALSGGVFQNALLTELCLDRLDAAGFDVRTHRLVPPNDGGLALGQAFVAAHGDLALHHTAASNRSSRQPTDPAPTRPPTTKEEH